jgi:hypothetical protein
MTFSEYCTYVRKRGYFSVRLSDNRSQPGISDTACDWVLEKWLVPILSVCESSFVYRIVFQDRPYDVTPPPRSSKPILLGRTMQRVELEGKAMLGREHRNYMAWALRHATVAVCVPFERLPSNALAKECWDPGILTNLGAIVSRGSLELARRAGAKKTMCFLFSRDSYAISCHVFGPPKDLLGFYKRCVINCRFILKGLERELKSVRSTK